jgi:hypothetical protein
MVQHCSINYFWPDQHFFSKYFLHKNNSLSADWTNGNPPSSKMRRTLSLIFCAPYVIISRKCPDINIYSSKSSQNWHGCLLDNILQLFKVSSFSQYTYM